MIKARLLSMQKSSVTKKILLVSFLVIFLFLALPSFGLAQVVVPPGGNANFDLQTPANFGIGNLDLKTIIGRIVQVLLGFLGTLAVLIIMYGGYVWMTSGGDPRKIDDAKRILRNAIIGLIIILMAFSIVTFILGLLGGGGGSGGPGPVNPSGPPPWGIGGGPIESVYPAPYATEVPINTWIAVTFKEAVDVNTICKDAIVDGGDGNGECNNEEMRNVEICGLVTGVCPGSGDFAVASFATTRATNVPGDHKTFVFNPNKYLGYEDLQDRIFQVTLLNAIHKQAAPAVSIFDGYLPGQYVWQFTTNGEVDLDPPEIVSTNAVLNPPGIPNISGVYPDPDSQADFYSASASPTHTVINLTLTAGTFTDEINASYTQPAIAVLGSPAATLTGTYGGASSGIVTVTMTAANQVTTNWPGVGNVANSYSGGTVLDIGPYGLVFTLGGPVAPGNSWTFNVTKYQAGDKIQVLDNTNPIKTYIFGTDITPLTLAAAWNKIKSDNLTIFEDCAPIVTGCIQTISTGLNSAKYGIGFVDVPAATTLSIVKTSGANATEVRTIRGTPDAYRNTVFQINFNEAINPLTVATIKVRYDQVPAYNNLTPDMSIIASLSAAVAPPFIASISNQYKTVELTGPIDCGVNNCGDKIYCWPINSMIIADPLDYLHKATLYEIDVPTAKLKTCVFNADCQGWGECKPVAGVMRCVKNVAGTDILLPTADPMMDGIIDMAANSANDSFNSYIDNGKVMGQADDKIYSSPIYYLNNTSPLYNPSFPALAGGRGDSFKYRFWLSDIIDLQSPLVKSIDPAAALPPDDAKTDDMLKPINLAFDRVMRSSTLLPGWGYGVTPKEQTTRYLALETKTLNINPVGYWISKNNYDDNGDSFPDHTEAFINHTLFGLYVRYGTLAGSGIESITQNCFLPGGGPDNAVNTLPDGCHYNSSGATVGCVTDAPGAAQVKMPNPASYAKLNCGEVTGAKTCLADVTHDCKSLYVPNTDEGSWIITKDHPAATFPVVNPYKTGCCLGKCVP